MYSSLVQFKNALYPNLLSYYLAVYFQFFNNWSNIKVALCSRLFSVTMLASEIIKSKLAQWKNKFLDTNAQFSNEFGFLEKPILDDNLSFQISCINTNSFFIIEKPIIIFKLHSRFLLADPLIQCILPESLWINRKIGMQQKTIGNFLPLDNMQLELNEKV